MLDEQATKSEQDQLDRIAIALEQLPSRLARAMHSEGIGLPKRPRMRQSFAQAEKDHREAREAKRRANIAIGLTSVTALASFIAAIATLIHG